MIKITNTIKFIFIIGLIALTLYVYFPGLLGGYMLDDLPNLSNINVFSRFEGQEAFIRYILSFDAGILKRPISTLSFLLDTTTLTVNPFQFKVTNLFIHIINGILLYFVTYKILSTQNLKSKNIFFLSFSNMAVWLLHPFFVSTTLYVIQRMAMLPTLFILLGMLLYLKGREEQYEDNVYGLMYIYIGVYLCTLLAVLSKENGVILPFFIILIENIILKRSSAYKLTKWHNVFIKLPVYIIVLIFLYKVPYFLNGYEEINFTLVERILTEARVLCTYLYHLYIPTSFTEGVFTDGFTISRSLISPVSTLYSLVFIFIIIIYAVLIRFKHPLISFSLLFYFTGHIIESTFIPLELYFEHRNYMPSLFLFIPIGLFLIKYLNKYNIKYMVVLLFILILSFLTHAKSIIWGDYNRLILTTVDRYPNSLRAIDEKVRYLYQNKNNEEALNLLEKSSLKHPNISLRVNLLNIKCLLNKETTVDFSLLNKYIKLNKLIKNDAASISGLLRVIITENTLNQGNELAEELINTIKQKNGFKIKNINKGILSKEIIVLLNLHKFEIATEKAINYFNIYHDFSDLLKITNLFIDFKEYQNANKLIKKLHNTLTLVKYRYTDKDYLKDLEVIKNKMKNITQ